MFLTCRVRINWKLVFTISKEKISITRKCFKRMIHISNCWVLLYFTYWGEIKSDIRTQIIADTWLHWKSCLIYWWLERFVLLKNVKKVVFLKQWYTTILIYKMHQYFSLNLLEEKKPYICFGQEWVWWIMNMLKKKTSLSFCFF